MVRKRQSASPNRLSVHRMWHYRPFCDTTARLTLSSLVTYEQTCTLLRKSYWLRRRNVSASVCEFGCPFFAAVTSVALFWMVIGPQLSDNKALANYDVQCTTDPTTNALASLIPSRPCSVEVFDDARQSSAAAYSDVRSQRLVTVITRRSIKFVSQFRECVIDR